MSEIFLQKKSLQHTKTNDIHSRFGKDSESNSSRIAENPVRIVIFVHGENSDIQSSVTYTYMLSGGTKPPRGLSVAKW